MKIGIDVRCLAEGKRTGVEEYTLALLRELFERDRDNEYVLFFNAWKSSAPDFSWATKYPHVSVKAFRFPNKLLNLALWYFRWPKLDRLVGGTDIFFLPNLNFAAVSSRSRLVVTAHDLSFELFPETFSWKQRLWHYFVNFRGLIRRADRVIAVSHSTRDDLMTEYGVLGKKIRVVPSGVGEQFRPFSRNDAHLLSVKEKYRLPYRFLLYLGTFEPRKNILSIVRAYEALRKTGHPAAERLFLVLAGGTGWKDTPLFEEIGKSPYKEDILFPGFIEDGDKAALYNLASVFVYPSFYEGFGFPPLEALGCGVPVITSHSSSLPEVVGEAAVLVDPYQPDELRLALEKVLSEKGFGESLRGKGLERAKAFPWHKTAEATVAVFRSL